MKIEEADGFYRFNVKNDREVKYLGSEVFVLSWMFAFDEVGTNRLFTIVMLKKELMENAVKEIGIDMGGVGGDESQCNRRSVLRYGHSDDFRQRTHRLRIRKRRDDAVHTSFTDGVHTPV